MAYAPAAKTYDVCFFFLSSPLLSPPCHDACFVVILTDLCNATFFLTGGNG
jgi:hypothetical protein